MGYQALSQMNATPFFQTMLSQGVVTTPSFSVNLATQDSALYLGGIDPRFNDKQIVYTPVTRQAFAQFKLRSPSPTAISHLRQEALTVF